MLNQLIRFFLEQKLVTVILLFVLIGWGLVTAPFRWEIPFLPSDPVPVDAIPDIGENQQIVFTEWMGRSPQDVEDQITYPLTTAMLGMPGVRSIRSTSMFGFSSVYLIFDDATEYYWSRSRILEKLNSLPSGLLPEGVQPKLGPDATALGQVFWYTLEGRDKEGRPAGGWDLHELRTIQDYYVRYALTGAEGVAEVATVGGHIKEYQVDLDPQAMKAYRVSMMEVMNALRKSNQDVGANTLEINQVEYLVRGLGYVKSIEDIEEAVVRMTNNVPVRIKDIARVNIGPADRSMLGILDKGGAEAVGGVVVARYGDNPLKVIENVKRKIEEISAGLPEKTLADGRTSKVTLVPFYDRSLLIHETLGTLNDAIILQILVTILVIMVMVYHLRASLLISALLPLSVLTCFIMMRYLGVDANIVALSGIAIAIGTMVDLGIILNENILKRLEEAPAGEPVIRTIYLATTEVATAILTAVSTTIISFLPVFTLEAAEGKLFGPLAWTKTFALISALLFTLVIMPAFSHWVLGARKPIRVGKYTGNLVLIALGILGLFYVPLGGMLLLAMAANNLAKLRWERYQPWHGHVLVGMVVVSIAWLLAEYWMPLGREVSLVTNFIFIGLVVGLVLGFFRLFILFYPRLLRWCLAHKVAFLALPGMLMVFALVIWMGAARILSPITGAFGAMGWEVTASGWHQSLAKSFPGMGKEFMPSLDEGAFLLMPTSMPHSGVEANRRIVQQLDMLVTAIPEVETVVGKAGRAETALDPAPLSMYENVILYRPEYLQDTKGRKRKLQTDAQGRFVLDKAGVDRYLSEELRLRDDVAVMLDKPLNEVAVVDASGQELQRFPAGRIRGITQHLVDHSRGRYFRQWRDHIRSADDIWNEIVHVVDIPGVTSAPKLQPIETRLVMLQTGMRAPMGMKVYGPDLKTIEDFSLQLEKYLKEVPSVKSEAVFADRSLGKPYLEIDLNRKAMARYGLNVADVQEYIEVALGGMSMSTTVEGRERYSIRARYAREYRHEPEAIGRVLIATPTGVQVPLAEMADITYRPGPMMIRGEESFLVGYVLLDKRDGYAEVTVVEEAKAYLDEKIASGELLVPSGVSFKFSGSYENQVRAEQRLMLVIPLCLVAIFLILYFQFRSVAASMFIFTAIAMAFAGGFIMLWLYGQEWFMNFSYFDTSIRELFQMRSFNLSVAVWVGFIALFGIATDDGVVMATYLKQNFAERTLRSREEIRQAVVEAGMRRVRPCLMTTATTLLALLPVLTSSGRGADIMIPMAIPSFGGMTVALITLFIVPVLWSWWQERQSEKIDQPNTDEI